jgi:hypothetical protein
VAEGVEPDEVESELRLLPSGEAALRARQAADGHRGAEQEVLEVTTLLELKEPFASGVGFNLSSVKYPEAIDWQWKLRGLL